MIKIYLLLGVFMLPIQASNCDDFSKTDPIIPTQEQLEDDSFLTFLEMFFIFLGYNS